MLTYAAKQLEIHSKWNHLDPLWKRKLLNHVWLFTTSCCTVLGIPQARILEWVAILFSRGSSQTRDQTQASHIAGRLSHKEISPGCSLKGLMLKLKLQYFGHLMRRTDWFQIGKGVHQGCILSPCLFNFHAENIMRNAGLEEAQAGMKIAWRNINNLRYADDTILMAESEEN